MRPEAARRALAIYRPVAPQGSLPECTGVADAFRRSQQALPRGPLTRACAHQVRLEKAAKSRRPKYQM
jgi:hypothetical protein